MMTDSSNVSSNVAAWVTAAAIESFALNNFKYVEQLDLYYDSQSKYFFKQGLNDFYHAPSQYAYRYNDIKNEYEWCYDNNWTERIGCSVDLEVFLLIEHLLDCADAEPGEIIASDDKEIYAECSSEYAEYLKAKSDEENIEPCIRFVYNNNLHIITIQGGSISLDENSEILIDGKSDQVCLISFDPDQKLYYLSRFVTETEIFLNDKLVENESVWLDHMDLLKIGSTPLHFHIHKGLNTCQDCEPGNWVPLNIGSEESVQKRVNKEKSRKRETQRLKALYGLERSPNIPEEKTENYVDRAGIRRKNVGSDESLQKTCRPVESASLLRSIPETNVGFKMLSKMGWNSGEKLGTLNTNGLSEPILPQIHVGTSGLGSKDASIIPNETNSHGLDLLKRQRLEKTMKRYTDASLMTSFDEMT